jgi:Leucine-rich repeat (LRR) protein
MMKLINPQLVEESEVQELPTMLEFVDLARNALDKIPPRTFSHLTSLKALKLNINAIRKVLFLRKRSLLKGSCSNFFIEQKVSPRFDCRSGNWL